MNSLKQIIEMHWNTAKAAAAIALIASANLATANPTLAEVKERTKILSIGDMLKVGTYEGISYELQGNADLTTTNWQYLCFFEGAAGTNSTSVLLPERQEKTFYYRVVAKVDDGFIEEE